MQSTWWWPGIYSSVFWLVLLLLSLYPMLCRLPCKLSISNIASCACLAPPSAAPATELKNIWGFEELNWRLTEFSILNAVPTRDDDQKESWKASSVVTVILRVIASKAVLREGHLVSMSSSLLFAKMSLGTLLLITTALNLISSMTLSLQTLHCHHILWETMQQKFKQHCKRNRYND